MPLIKMGVVSLLLSPALCAQTAERLSLQEAISQSLVSNPDILRAWKEIDAAGGRVLQAGRIANSELGISWSGVPTALKFGDADEREIGIVQQIEFPTKRSGRVAIASSDREIAELQLQRAQVVLTAQVKKAYYALVLSQEIVKSLEGQLTLLRDFQQLLQSRFAAAASNYLDVVRSKVEIARTMNDLTEARREVQLRASQLKLLMGRGGDGSLMPSDSLVYAPMPGNRDSLIAQFGEQSVALKIVHRIVTRQQLSLSLAETSYLPDFSVGLAHQRIAGQPPYNANNFGGVATNTVGVQFGVSVPLWFWQEPRGQVKEAEAQVEIARVGSASTERRIRASILNGFRSVEVAESQLQLFDRSLLADVNDILRTGIDQYRNDQIDVLNLVDIYRTYRATRVEYLRALTNALVARADLEAASEQITE